MKLRELLENYKLEQLQETVSYLGLITKDNQTKEEYIDLISFYLLNENNFRRLLYILPEESYQKVIDGSVSKVKSDDIKLFSTLRIYSMGFVYNDELIIPSEYKALFEKFNTKEEREYREKEQYLYACVNFANVFYCVYPFEALKKLININTRLHYSNNEIKERVEDLPEAVGLTYVKNIDAYVNMHNDYDLEDLLKTQGNVPFFLPTYKQIIEFFESGMLNSPEYDTFMTYSKYFNDGIGDEARILTFNALATIKDANDDLFESIFDRSKFENITKENEVKHNFASLIRNTKNVWHRGFSKQEMFARTIY